MKELDRVETYLNYLMEMFHLGQVKLDVTELRSDAREVAITQYIYNYESVTVKINLKRWEPLDDGTKVEVLAHELFHILQRDQFFVLEVLIGQKMLGKKDSKIANLVFKNANEKLADRFASGLAPSLKKWKTVTKEKTK